MVLVVGWLVGWLVFVAGNFLFLLIFIILSHVCLSLPFFSSLSLLTSISVHFNLCLFSLVSFSALRFFFISSLSQLSFYFLWLSLSLSLSLSLFTALFFLNSLTMFTRSVGSLSLSARTALTFSEFQGAWALALSVEWLIARITHK